MHSHSSILFTVVLAANLIAASPVISQVTGEVTNTRLYINATQAQPGDEYEGGDTLKALWDVKIVNNNSGPKTIWYEVSFIDYDWNVQSFTHTIQVGGNSSVNVDMMDAITGQTDSLTYDASLEVRLYNSTGQVLCSEGGYIWWQENIF